MAMCIFVSTRLMRGPFRFRWYDGALASIGVALRRLATHLRAHRERHVCPDAAAAKSRPGFRAAVSALLLGGFLLARPPHGLACLQVLAIVPSVVGRAVGRGAIRTIRWMEMFGSAGHLLGPVPQMLLGIAMVMVLFENERNAVQENTLALSTLGVDPRRLLSADDLLPSMQSALERLAGALSAGRAVIYISERWRGLVPSVERGFSAQFLDALTRRGAATISATWRTGMVACLPCMI